MASAARGGGRASQGMDIVIAQNLSARVEAAIRKVLGGAEDEFDAPDFDAIEYINRHFPSEASLSSQSKSGGSLLSSRIVGMESEIGELDESILSTVREQSVSGASAARDIVEARDSIGDLNAKIADMATASSSCERMVTHICADIKQLDVAKTALTSTIQAVGRLQALSMTVLELEAAAERCAYEDATPTMAAALDMFAHFSGHRDLNKVADLASRVKRVSEDLERKIMDQFEYVVTTVTPRSLAALEAGYTPSGDEVVTPLDEDQLSTLSSVCALADALGVAVRRRVCTSYLRKQLAPYIALFRPGSDMGEQLEFIDKRFAWFTVALRTLELRHGRFLPPTWSVPHRFALEFAATTRTDMTRILSRYEPHLMPAEPFLRALVRTHKWVEVIDKKYDSNRAAPSSTAASSSSTSTGAGGEEDALLVNDKGQVVDPSSAEGIKLKYKKKADAAARVAAESSTAAARKAKSDWYASLGGGDVTSSRAAAEDEVLPSVADLTRVFTPYMEVYIRYERAQLESAGAEDGLEVMRASTQMFLTARTAAKRAADLECGEGEPLLSLVGDMAAAFESHAGALQRRLPRPDPPSPAAFPGDTYSDLNSNEGAAMAAVDMTAQVAVTAEYCAETFPALADACTSLLKQPELKSRIDFAPVIERFYTLQVEALKAAGAVVASLCDPALQSLMRTSWHTLTEVGDASPYTAQVAHTLFLVFPRLRARLGDGAFRIFCDKFIRAFTPRYRAALFMCKRIGEMGAQQLLLDAQAIKSALLAAPVHTTSRAASGGDGDDDDALLAGGDAAAAAPGTAPPMYINFISKEIPRIEMWLKIASVHRDRFVDTIRTLWPQAVATDVTGLCEKRGMNARETEAVLAALGLAAARAGVAAPLASASAIGSSMGAAVRDLGRSMNVSNVTRLFGAPATAAAPAPAPAAAPTRK